MYCYENKTLLEISSVLGIGERIIMRCTKKNELDRCYKDKEWLTQKHYIERKNTVEMAEEANCSVDSIRGWMKKHDLKVSMEVANDGKRKYNFNHDFFNHIDTEKKAYWLGFIMADAYISSKDSQFKLSLARRDKGHLQKFLNDLESDYVIKDYDNHSNLTNKVHPMSKVVITSIRFHSTLITKGVLPQKTGNEQKPNIPLSFYKDFVRGYFDGDGTISCGVRDRSRVYKTQTTYSKKIWSSGSILGGEIFLKGMSDFFYDELGIKPTVRKKSDYENVHQMSFSDGNLKIIMDWFYEGATVYLDRKKEKYEEYLSLLERKEDIELKDIVRTPIEKRRVEQK